MLWRDHGQKCFSEEQQLVRLVDQRPPPPDSATSLSLLYILIPLPSLFCITLHHAAATVPCGRPVSPGPKGQLSQDFRDDSPSYGRRRSHYWYVNASRLLKLETWLLILACLKMAKRSKWKVNSFLIRRPTLFPLLTRFYSRVGSYPGL